MRKSDDPFEGKDVVWLFEWKPRELIFSFYFRQGSLFTLENERQSAVVRIWVLDA